MGRKRKQIQRQPNGQPHRPPDVSPATLKRGRDAALSGLRAAEFGTQAGQMRLAGLITQNELDECHRLSGIVAAYRRAIGGPASVVAAAIEKGSHGHSMASQEASADAWQAQAIARYDQATGRLMLRGPAVMRATVKLAADEYMTWQEREWGRVGLAQLALDAQGGRRV